MTGRLPDFPLVATLSQGYSGLRTLRRLYETGRFTFTICSSGLSLEQNQYVRFDAQKENRKETDYCPVC